VQAAPLDQVHPDATKIRVGIKLLEPFVFIGEDVQPSGFNIDLWNAIAAETLNELITALQSGRTDLASPGSV
jgi:ABC-type amino acid transport substrate-binding protein